MTKKKSILEKWGLVESSEEEFNLEEVIESQQALAQEVDEYIAQNPSVSFEGEEDFLAVSEIYEKVGIDDLDKSIFKVDEFGKHLPDNLPSDVKRESVIGILTASGLKLDELLLDAEVRSNSLKEVLELTTEKSAAVVAAKEQEIVELANKIDSLKQDIIDRKAAQENQDSMIDEELSKIDEILKFISSN